MRERRDHVDGHWFGSTNIPLSTLTARINLMVPDRHFPIHLLDWQDPASDATHQRLLELGYRNIIRCPTGKPGQYGDGFVKGEYVWSKAFGEIMAHGYELPEVTPADYLGDESGGPFFLMCGQRPGITISPFGITEPAQQPAARQHGGAERHRPHGAAALCRARVRSWGMHAEGRWI